jgi:hypothetical protein
MRRAAARKGGHREAQTEKSKRIAVAGGVGFGDVVVDPVAFDLVATEEAAPPGTAGLMDRCFFTNAYMGLRRGEGTTGRFPGSLDKGFVDRCRRFLLRQLDAQQPWVILTLGTWVPSFLSALSPELAKWERVGSIRDLDAAGPLVHGAVFGTREPLRCTVAALTHPSLRGSNVGRRSYAGVRGHDAEMAMLRDALDSSGVREA